MSLNLQPTKLFDTFHIMSSHASNPGRTYGHPFCLSLLQNPFAEISRPRSVIDFLGLPREIRDMVHEHSLCVDGVLAPHKNIFRVDGDYEGPKPTVALLVTNS